MACRREFRGGERFAHHWHDLTRLDAAGFADAAIADLSLAQAVANHKSVFFAEKAATGDMVNYHAAVSGGIQLVPGADAMSKLAADYHLMVDDGLLLDDAESFEYLMVRCRTLQQKINSNRPDA
ncbi:hypothetical protein LNV08_09080 [Paucibacter sp. TC2R-5]|uniref:hypothetical protein n=1 Tax=Paucibacter sp. TC2R-5 TaxID=2893555 RepID=UPI0021E366C6|nr:hypothetical protein [Paucibacter sp. TC2R-5]MCV2359128.1 hypothetical protein [Paucibacter sp. TC2R-5]